jgi:hypothetical protein
MITEPWIVQIGNRKGLNDFMMWFFVLLCRYHRFKLSAKGIQKDGNTINYQKYLKVLFHGYQDIALNKTFIIEKT